MDISNKVAIAISIPKIIGTIYFLEAGYGLPGLMINNGIILGISSIINFIIAFKIFPELRFSLSLFSRSIFKKLFSFGYKLQIARVSTWISGNIDKLLISYFLSIGWVTFYELGSSIVDKTKSVVLLFVSALIPAFSEIDARGERKKLIDGYIRGTKYITLISAPLFIFIIVSARQIMMIWLGAGYETSARIIQILSVGWFFAVLSVMRAIIVQAIAKPEIEMKSGLAAAILNIPLSIIFIIQFGFVGVALGTSISLFLSVIYAIIKLHKELRLSVSHFIKTTILKTVVICICIGLFVWVVTIALQGILSESSRITSLIIFIIQVVLFFAIYFYALLYTKPFDNVDVMLLVKDKPSLIRQIMIKFSQKDR